MPDSFNPHMLALARDSRGLTQSGLAEAMGFGQAAVSKYEAGLTAPTEEAVAAMSRALGYPLPFFSQPGTPYGFPPFHFRKRKKLPAKALGRIVAQMNLRRMHVSRLTRSLDHRPNRPFFEIDLDEFQGSSRKLVGMEEVARLVREHWMVPTGPIGDLVGLIEDNGGIVIVCDFGTDQIDAMSQRIDGLPALFFVNATAPADRVRLTLAHEIAHMVLHHLNPKSDDDMEREADEFAGAFLLPAAEFRAQLRRFDLRQLANMKPYWKVSMAAMAVRAHRLNLISPYQFKTFFIELGKLGYRRREPHEPPPETPTRLNRMIEFHRRDLRYSDEDLARLLCLTPGEFGELYAPATDAVKSHLRLVK